MADEAVKTNEEKPKRMALLCVDSSEYSVYAMEWYFQNFHHEGDDVGLAHVHVLPDMPGFGLFAKHIYDEVHEAKYFDKDGQPIHTPFSHHEILDSVKESHKVVAKDKQWCQLKGVEPKVFVETMHDSIGHTICKIAQENNASFIIMGQRGLGTIRRTLLGSVSTYVLHHSNIPVIVVPPEPTN